MLMFPFFSELTDWNRNWSQGKVPFTDPLCRAYEFFCLISCSFWAQHSKFSVGICIRLGISVTFQFKGSVVIQCWRCSECSSGETRFFLVPYVIFDQETIWTEMPSDIIWANIEVQTLLDSFAAREDPVVVLPTNTFYLLGYSF